MENPKLLFFAYGDTPRHQTRHRIKTMYEFIKNFFPKTKAKNRPGIKYFSQHNVPGGPIMELQQLAGICHEANRALCKAVSDPAPPQESWEKTPAIIRDSVIVGVRFRLNNPAADPSKSHEEWLKYKEAEGWKHGEVKDIEAKTHPNMVPFNEIPTEQQAKDFLFAAIVEALAPLVDEPGDEEKADDSESGD